MKKLLLCSVALMAAACNNTEVGLVIEEVPPPDFDEGEGTCSFQTGTVEYGIIYDTANMSSLFLRTEVTNTLSSNSTQLTSIDPIINLQFPNRVSPRRFDFRWECDSNGFSAGRGPLFLPAFSVDNPFCLDTRDEANADFVGFDTVDASGAPVAPGQTGIWGFDAITAELDEAFDQAFRLAELSDDCCELAGGNCQNAPTFAAVGACAELQATLDSIVPGRLSVQDPATLDIWRPYVLFTLQGTLDRNETVVADFSMRLRGIYEGITDAGDMITSAELLRNIGICKGGDFNGVFGACTARETIFCYQK